MLDERILTAFKQQNRFSLELDRLLMACRVGSHSHGTYDPKPGNLDDVDYMLVVLPPANKLIGLSKWEHWTFQQDELDVVAYSIDKYIRLILKSNPNVLGTMYLQSEDYLFRSVPFKRLQAMREKLASLHAYPAFCGYAQAQLKRLEKGAYQGYMGADRKALVEKFGYDPKNASHLIRLYRMGLEFVSTGILTVYRPDREELKAIKRGEWTLDQIKTEAAELEAKMKIAKETSPLRIDPDWEAAEEFLIDTQATEVLGWWHEHNNLYPEAASSTFKFTEVI